MNASESEDQEEPKLVVDTDWKEQVAREKESASQANADVSSDTSQTEAPPEPTGEPAESTEAASLKPESAEPESDDSEPADEQEIHPPPPASFDVLVSMLFTQAMALLGQMPEPGSGETRVNKPYAKHYIDTLDMLGEKTKGNLSEQEEKMLSEALHALRMMYVNVKA